MPYHVSLVFRTFTSIFPCFNSSSVKIRIRYSAFKGLPGTSFSRNSLKPSSSTFRKSRVNPHIFIETREFISTITPSASAPVAVFTMFLVATTSVRLFCSSSCGYHESHHHYRTVSSSTQIQPYKTYRHSPNTHRQP